MWDETGHETSETRNTACLELLDKISDQSEDLNDWELDFIDNLKDKPEGYNFSARQYFKLVDIWEKI